MNFTIPVLKNNNSDYFDCCGLKLNKRTVAVVATATVGLAALVAVDGQDKIAIGTVKCLNQFTSIMTTYATELLFTGLFYLGSLVVALSNSRRFSLEMIILGGFFNVLLWAIVGVLTFSAKVFDFYHEGLFTHLELLFKVGMMTGYANLLYALAYALAKDSIPGY